MKTGQQFVRSYTTQLQLQPICPVQSILFNNSTVGTIENLGTTLKHVKRLQRCLLSLIEVKIQKAQQLIVIRIKVKKDKVVILRKFVLLSRLSCLVVDYVTVIFKLYIFKFQPVIRTYYFNSIIRLLFSFCFKSNKTTKSFRFQFQQIKIY